MYQHLYLNAAPPEVDYHTNSVKSSLAMTPDVTTYCGSSEKKT